MTTDAIDSDDDEGDDEGDDEPIAADAPSAVVPLTDGHRRSHLGVAAFDAAGRPSVLEHSFVVEGECHGWRLDRFLMKRMRRLSRARIQRVIRGDLDIGGVKVTKPAATVLSGQIVSFRRPAPVEPEVVRDVSLLHTDDAFYVFDKPAGLPVHPTARYHYGTLTSLLRERFPGETIYICHRLDRETSGVLLAARTREAAATLKRAFARRQVQKSYLAIVTGELEGDRIIDEPLGLAGERVRVKMAVRSLEEGGLPSRTRVRLIEKFRGCSLVEARPETGRQHQIRVHLAHIGHPILGDKLYPDDELFIDWADHGMSDALLAKLRLPRHALHAASLTFSHPSTGASVTIESPLPADLREFLERI